LGEGSLPLFFERETMEVLIGTPSYSGQFCVEYVRSIAETMPMFATAGVPAGMVIMSGHPFVDNARNKIVDHFLKSTATDLLFIDDDVGWDYKAVGRILSHDVDVCAGLVPKRSEKPGDYHQNALTGVVKDGLFQSMEAPTAFMRIRRSAFERLDSAFPELKSLDTTHDYTPYFLTGIYNGQYIGEDIFFCRKWVELGEFLWIDPDITFTHRGPRVWQGNFYDHGRETGLILSQE
jgi:hypothetical protein